MGSQWNIWIQTQYKKGSGTNKIIIRWSLLDYQMNNEKKKQSNINEWNMGPHLIDLLVNLSHLISCVLYLYVHCSSHAYDDEESGNRQPARESKGGKREGGRARVSK